MKGDKKKSTHESTKGIAWLSTERSAEFENVIDTIFEQHRYFDFKIIPKLCPTIENGEDAFRWKFDWQCEVGMPDDIVLQKDDLSESQKRIVNGFAKELGWHLVQELKSLMPVPWEGSSFSLSGYAGHPSWKYVADHPNTQGFNWNFSIGDRSSRRIVGILQVKDADLLIEPVIKNTLDMLDWLIVLDNNSTDNTLSEVHKIKEMSDKVLVKKILTVNSGGRYLNSLCGTDTVVVRIDADEVWHPEYAKNLRNELQITDFPKIWKIISSGWMLDVNGVDLDNEVCVGLLQDVRNYYFGNIMAWSQGPERLHGAPMTLRTNTTSDNFVLQTCAPSDGAAILHFTFLCLSSNGRENFRPSTELHKREYVEEDPSKWKVSQLAGFGISDNLSKILGKQKIWSVFETHPHLM